MDNNKKTLLIAVLILLLALVAFNFNKISGKQVLSDVRVPVSPSQIVFGKYDPSKFITLNVNAGSLGLDEELYLYQVDNARVGSFNERLCNKNMCYTDDIRDGGVAGMKRVTLSKDLKEGTYFFRVYRKRYDIQADSNTFRVSHKS